MCRVQKYVYFPRKTGEGWRVAHTIRMMGIRIDRFQPGVCNYQEAYRRAITMNKQLTDNDTVK
ncbi:hypothetical protein J8L08_09780 [Bacteroides fragilis]|uniref:hypothetical protein n=1 Tax=Bacteroides fragilis TaxID=817 RepID=UPI002030F274|nr:hypothetical protein [Bacteroides fragilis]MCM0275916.1 hypothetical protein [Bacteroides fragilis]